MLIETIDICKQDGKYFHVLHCDCPSLSKSDINLFDRFHRYFFGIIKLANKDTDRGLYCILPEYKPVYKVWNDDTMRLLKRLLK